MPQSKRHPVVLGAIDLGAHSARMLIAQCGPAPGVIEILEDLDVSVPLGITCQIKKAWPIRLPYESRFW